MGKSERDTVLSLVQRIIEHFLLIKHSPATDQRLHWSDEVDELRDRIERKLSPTVHRRLKRGPDDLFARAWRRPARKMHRRGEHHAAAALPGARPYRLEQVFGDWLSGERDA